MLELLLAEPQLFSVCTTSGVELSGAAFGGREFVTKFWKGFKFKLLD